MKTFSIFIFISIFVYLSLQSCNPISSENISNKILITDSTGFIVGGNYDDWCLADSADSAYARPPYPNPAPANKKIKIQVEFDYYELARIIAYFDDGQLAMDAQAFETRVHEIDCSGLGYNNEVRKLTIEVKNLQDGSLYYTCSGHVQF